MALTTKENTKLEKANAERKEQFATLAAGLEAKVRTEFQGTLEFGESTITEQSMPSQFGDHEAPSYTATIPSLGDKKGYIKITEKKAIDGFMNVEVSGNNTTIDVRRRDLVSYSNEVSTYVLEQLRLF